VAFYAVVAILAVMHILMAGYTSVFIHICPVLEDGQGIFGGSMAFEAINFIMGTPQGKLRGVVVKIPLATEFGKSGLRMALRTGTCQLPGVGVVMAIYAIGKAKPAELLEFLPVPGGFFMAFRTIH
jgi:hypothetical protein